MAAEDGGKPTSGTSQRLVKTALHQAVVDGRLHQVRLLVANRDVSVDSRDVNGRTSLMLACLLDPADLGQRMARMFLRAGAYIGTHDRLGRTALSYACLKGRDRLVRQLLKNEIVEVTTPDNDGNTPLHHAALSGNADVVHLLVQHYAEFGISVDARNSLGYTPLLLACKYGHFRSAHWLLGDGKASPALRDSEYFLNARDWMMRSRHLQAAVSSSAPPLRTRSSTDALSFSREYSMYGGGPSQHHCHHFHRPVHPMLGSMDSALHLPAIFSHTPTDGATEPTMIDGQEARDVVLKEIENFLSNPKLKPKGSSRRQRRRHPPTAKLLALDRRSVSAIDMRTIFKIYSESYQEEPPAKHEHHRPSLAAMSSVATKSKAASSRHPSITIKSVE